MFSIDHPNAKDVVENDIMDITAITEVLLIAKPICSAVIPISTHFRERASITHSLLVPVVLNVAMAGRLGKSNNLIADLA